MKDVDPKAALAVLERAELVHDRDAVTFALDQLSVRMTVELAEQNPLLICIMNGGLRVTSELASRLHFPLTLDYLHLTRYRGGTSGGELEWRAFPQQSLADKVVVLIDDVLDHGHTMAAAREWALAQGCARVYSAVLVDKQIPGDRPALAEFAALQAVDRYLFGSGMDWHGYWRNLPAVYALHQEDEAAELG